MRTGHLIILSAAWLLACDGGSSDPASLYVSSLSTIKRHASGGFLVNAAEVFNRNDASLLKMADNNEAVGGGTAMKYRRTYRRRVIKILLDKWPIISSNTLKWAGKPRAAEKQQQLDWMFEGLADLQLSKKWAVLTEQRRRLVKARMGKSASRDADESRGKVLAWHEGTQDRQLLDCVLDLLRPLAPGKRWLVKRKVPSEAARKAAWGTVAVHAKLRYKEYTDRSEEEREVQVATSLKLTIRAKLPDRPELPDRWEVEVVKPNPGRIEPKYGRTGVERAQQLNIKRLKELFTESCKKFRQQGIPKP